MAIFKTRLIVYNIGMLAKITQILKTKYEYIFPILHFILSFALEGKIASHISDYDLNYMAVREGSHISDSAERMMVYILSKIFCAIFIFLGWKLFFAVIKGRIPKHMRAIFYTIFVVGLLAGLILYPDTFGIEPDNYTNYSYAVRMMPTYWHAVFMGAIYEGALMMLPHPAIFVVLQWTLFVCVVGYIYYGISLSGEKGAKWAKVSLLFFLIPESYYIAYNPYRNNIFTLLVLGYFAYLLLWQRRDAESRIDIRENRDNENSVAGIGNKATTCRYKLYKEIIIFTILTAFIMVLRSEGLFIGLGGVAIYAINLCWFNGNINRNDTKIPVDRKDRIRMIAVLALSLCISYIAMSKCQSIGSDKYYGKDYMILNTTNVLENVLNNPNANLSYAGAEEDLTSIEVVVPIQLLKEYGSLGFRSYNYSKGYVDFNQSLAGGDAAGAYMKAYYRIILHNMDSFLDVQINNFLMELGLNPTRELYAYTGEHTEIIPAQYYTWMVGEIDLKATPYTSWWANNSIRLVLKAIVQNVIELWSELFTASGLNGIIHAILLIWIVIMFIYELAMNIDCRFKNRDRLILLIVLAVILSETVAILLFSPEARDAYLYPVLYLGYFVAIPYIRLNI